MYIENGKIIRFSRVDSTNLEAYRILEKENITESLWILSDEQTHGKGRMGNKWISIKGNLYTSLIIPVFYDLNILPMLSCVIALSVYDCISKSLKDNSLLKVKWPNDILYNNSKLSGILIENIITDSRKHSIIGIGININSSPIDLDHQTTYLNTIECIYKKINVKDVFKNLQESIMNDLNLFKPDFMAKLKRSYEEKAWKLNEVVEIISENKLKCGILKGFTDNFEIIIEIDEVKQIFNSGELSFKY